MPAKLPEHYFEQYKLAVDMADKVSARRGLANTFFISVHGVLASILTIVSKDGLDSTHGSRGIAFLCVVGLIVCFTWWLTIRSYRDLNAAKFNVITSMETKLPVQVFGDEWKTLKKDPIKFWRKRYSELTSVEKIVPILFALSYIYVFVEAVNG